jgi:hypothetical protein
MSRPSGNVFQISSKENAARYIETDDGLLYSDQKTQEKQWADITGTPGESRVRKALTNANKDPALLLAEKKSAIEHIRQESRSNLFNDSKRMLHLAPGKDSYSLVKMDFVREFMMNTGEGRNQTAQEDLARETASLILTIQEKPPAFVTIYRSCPKQASEILVGDWVSLLPDYAIEHGQRYDSDDFHVLSKRVSPTDVFSDGNSVHEFGYSPHPKKLSPALQSTVTSVVEQYKEALTPEQLSRKIMHVISTKSDHALDKDSSARLAEHLKRPSKTPNDLFELIGEELARVLSSRPFR